MNSREFIESAGLQLALPTHSQGQQVQVMVRRVGSHMVKHKLEVVVQLLRFAASDLCHQRSSKDQL
jgi:hypothetical protein